MNAIDRYKSELGDLSFEDRVELREFLTQSIDNETEIDEDIRATIRRRMEEVERGQVALIDCDLVLRELDEKYP